MSHLTQRVEHLDSHADYVEQLWATNGARPAKPRPSSRYHAGLLSCAPPPTKHRTHLAQKPVQMLRDLVVLAPAAGTICDPFMGSGSTGVAAVLEGRRFVGIERDPVHFEEAVRRIEQALREPWACAA